MKKRIKTFVTIKSDNGSTQAFDAPYIQFRNTGTTNVILEKLITIPPGGVETFGEIGGASDVTEWDIRFDGGKSERELTIVYRKFV